MEVTHMRSSHALALVLGATGLGTACGGDGNGSSNNGPSNIQPAAAFTSSCALLVCTFADGSSDADGRVTAYSWDFGDGAAGAPWDYGDGAAGATTKDAQHTYAAANTYPVTLTVTDNGGAANSVTKSVEVNAPPNAPPTASFTSSCTDLTCTFTDLSSDGDGTVVGFQWDFGYGAVAATQNPSHVFASAGTYVVALTVTDDRGATGTRSQPVTVTAPQTTAPTIALGVSPLLQNLCYPARAYSTRGCPSGGYVTISNTGGGTLNWTSTTSATWLKRSPTSGIAPSTMKVWVDGTGLPPGSYSGDILVSATGATNSPRGTFVHVTRY
jgi:PKD repeat protein